MNNGEEMKKAAARSSMGKAVKRLGIEVKGRSDRGVGKRWYDWPRIEDRDTLLNYGINPQMYSE